MSRYRYFLVTFDLKNSASKTNQYRAVRKALAFRFGEDNCYNGFIKQSSIVRTDESPEAITETMRQKIGSAFESDVFIIEVTPYALPDMRGAKRIQALEMINRMEVDAPEALLPPPRTSDVSADTVRARRAEAMRRARARWRQRTGR